MQGHPEGRVAEGRIHEIVILSFSLSSVVISVFTLIAVVSSESVRNMPVERDAVRSCDVFGGCHLAHMSVQIDSIAFGTFVFAEAVLVHVLVRINHVSEALVVPLAGVSAASVLHEPVLLIAGFAHSVVVVNEASVFVTVLIAVFIDTFAVRKSSLDGSVILVETNFKELVRQESLIAFLAGWELSISDLTFVAVANQIGAENTVLKVEVFAHSCRTFGDALFISVAERKVVRRTHGHTSAYVRALYLLDHEEVGIALCA